MTLPERIISDKIDAFFTFEMDAVTETTFQQTYHESEPLENYDPENLKMIKSALLDAVNENYQLTASKKSFYKLYGEYMQEISEHLLKIDKNG